MVVVGHSLGGILAKMMVQSGGPRLWQTVCGRPFDQVALLPEECRLLRQAFFYKPVPEVRRVIFIATPHRGSPLASSRVGELATRLCWRENRFRHARELVWSQNQPDIFPVAFRGERATSGAELAPSHPLLLKLGDLGIDRSVRSHSVIADLRDPPKPDGTDGIVPFSSSHLDGVASELLVNGAHMCLSHQSVIEEIGRVLLEHLENESALPLNDQLSRPRERPGHRAASTQLARRAGAGNTDLDVFQPRHSRRTHPMSSPNEVYTKVSKVLVDALGVDEDDIKPSATLQGDLGRSPSISWTSYSDSSVSLDSRFRVASCLLSESSSLRDDRAGWPRDRRRPRRASLADTLR